jgi:hypothetical protein
VSARREASSDLQLLFACLAIGAGGLLLGLQVDGTGSLVGTGYTALGIGVVVALFASALQAARGAALPRDPPGILSAVCGFCGISFVVAGVLAPGGGWMFFEVLLLLVLLARSKSAGPGPQIGKGTSVALALMLVFRLWITYQGSERRWQVAEVDVPIVSWIPFPFLDPIRSVSLGEFTPREMGFPPSGLDFPLSMTLWSAGFALAVSGLLWRARAGLERENDRIHAIIHELPPPLALLVEKILPEEDWRALGLHGLPERLLRKRIQALVEERIAQRRDIDQALRSAELLARTSPGGFAGEIHAALIAREPVQPRPAEVEG